MLPGVLLLLVSGVALVAGSGLLGSGLAGIGEANRLPAATVRSTAVGLGTALAATVIAVGQGKTALASGIPFGAAMFLLASAFGAAALLGRRPLEMRDPVTFAAPAAAVVLVALSLSTDRSFTRIGGILLTVVYIPYLAWILLEPGRESPVATDGSEPLRPDARPEAAWWPDPEVSAATPGPADGAVAIEPEAAAAGTSAAGPGRTGWVGVLVAGLALVVGGAFAVVEGATRVAVHAPLAPGFAGAAVAGSLVALPFTLLVVFPRRRGPHADPDVSASTMTVVTGLLTLVPGLAAIIRPYEVDGPAAVAALAVALLYAVPATWMLLRGRGGRVMGAVVLAAYAVCLLIAGSL